MDTKYAEESKQLVSDQTAPLITFQVYTLCPSRLGYLDTFPDLGLYKNEMCLPGLNQYYARILRFFQSYEVRKHHTLTVVIRCNRQFFSVVGILNVSTPLI